MMTRSLAALAVLLLLAGCKEKRTGPVDFVRLVSEAYPEGGGRNDAKTEELWLELNRLPSWHFTTTKELFAQKQPSIELLAGGSWLVASTDLMIARGYTEKRGRGLAQAQAAPAPPADPTKLAPSPFDLNAPAAAPDAAVAAAAPQAPKVNPYVADDGTPLVVTMTPDEAIAYLEGYRGPPLQGVRFNEGAARNFFGDLDAVVSIRKALKANGSLTAQK